MAEITLNGVPVMDAIISMPLHGAWVAKVVCDSAKEQTGVASINCGGVTFSGTIRHGSVWLEGFSCSIVGGSGTLSRNLEAKSYANVPLYIPLQEALGGQGISLDSSQTILDTKLPMWIRFSGTASSELAHLVNVVKGSWRILADGNFWIGEDTFPESSIVGDIATHNQQTKSMRVLTEKPLLYPGITWKGYKLSYVQHVMSSRNFTTEVWYE